MKNQMRGIVGLHRAACDALEAAIRGSEAAMAFNGYNWLGGPLNEVQEIDVAVVQLVNNPPRIDVMMSELLSHGEAREIEQQLRIHAETHSVDLSI